MKLFAFLCGELVTVKLCFSLRGVGHCETAFLCGELVAVKLFAFLCGESAMVQLCFCLW